MGQCTFVPEKKGHQKPKRCTELEVKDGLCALHQPPKPRVTVTEVTPTWECQPANGTTTVNSTFQHQCNGLKTLIDNICLGGTRGSGGGQTFTGTKGTFQLLHATQPSANNTIFYRWQGPIMMVFGVGGHVGNNNKKYKLTWYDGKDVTVSLQHMTIGG